MQTIVIHRNSNGVRQRQGLLLRLAGSSKLIADIVAGRLNEKCRFGRSADIVIALPCELHSRASNQHIKITYYRGNLPVCLNTKRKGKWGGWFVLSNGRFVTDVDWQHLNRILSNFDADIIAVDVDPALQAHCGRVRFASCGNVVGFGRFYNDLVLPAPIGADWPCHLFLKVDALREVVVDDSLPLVFSDFVDRCVAKSLKWQSLKIGGTVLDLETEGGLLRFLMAGAGSTNHYSHRTNLYKQDGENHSNGCRISSSARIFGKVVLGNNVKVDDDVIILGPTILCDDVQIVSKAVVRASVIGPGVWVPKGCLIQNHILEFSGPRPHSKLLWLDGGFDSRQFISAEAGIVDSGCKRNNFRIWPRFSYARFWKRTADIIFSLAVLILFVPVFVMAAIVIKLSSRGPVFFKHKRQGLHGREFFCLKFRTMIMGADEIQERLRCKNEVDGPQFKIESDPRVTVVGRFLRDTYIDEIPQFINILFGQMSVIGPRPSPERENYLCPFWRDGRLSVRPGITGLWQICRTRRPSHDFQEWIYYDTKYIKELSLRLDLWIFCKTVKRLITNFVDQF